MSLWDIYQHIQIGEAHKDARHALRKAEGQHARVDEANDRLERLTLVCQSMWELLRDHCGLTEEQLKEKVLEVDARDGSIDGKLGNEVITCPHCSQKTGTRRGRCICCGGRVEGKRAFK